MALTESMDAADKLTSFGATAPAEGTSSLRNIATVLVIVVVELTWLAFLVFLAGALIFG